MGTVGLRGPAASPEGRGQWTAERHREIPATRLKEASDFEPERSAASLSGQLGTGACLPERGHSCPRRRAPVFLTGDHEESLDAQSSPGARGGRHGGLLRKGPVPRMVSAWHLSRFRITYIVTSIDPRLFETQEVRNAPESRPKRFHLDIQAPPSVALYASH